MKESVPVHERQSVEHLIKDLSYRCLRKVRVSLLDHLVQVLFHVLKNKVQSVILPDHLL